MEEVKKTIEKAEKYLHWTVDQKWGSSIAKAKNKSSKEYIEKMDWPLRFEAYSYLRNRHKDKITNFGVEIRDLWNEWIGLYKKGHLGGGGIFWPFFPDNEVESHISMFRAKEFFGIGGFHNYFAEARRRIELDLLPTHKSKVTWQFIRSPFLKSVLASIFESKVFFYIYGDLITFLARGEKGYSATQNSSLLNIIQMAFSLCFVNKFIDTAKKAASILMDYQKRNGSFIDSTLGTCLCAYSIHATNVDPSNFVCNKALEYILNKQNKEGWWSLKRMSTDSSIGWKTFSTVLVLDIINFLSGYKVLTERVEEGKLSDTPTKHPRIQIDKPLLVPKGINWWDVSIWFINSEEVEVRAKTPLGIKNYITMGFVDKRKKKPKEYKPDLAWNALKSFAGLDGEISWKDKGVKKEVQNSMKYLVKVIRIRLKFLFDIQSDPFYPYNRKEKSYKTIFKISYRENAQD